MKAIVQETYGAPERALRLEEVDRPLVGDDDVLIQVRATSVNTPDWITVYAAQKRGNPRSSRVVLSGSSNIAGLGGHLRAIVVIRVALPFTSQGRGSDRIVISGHARPADIPESYLKPDPSFSHRSDTEVFL